MSEPALAPRGVLWDLDGTLVDSTMLHFDAWRAVLAELGLGLTFDAFRETFGMTNASIVPRFLGHDPGPERTRALGDDKEARYRALVRRHGVTVPAGVREWLARLRAAGWRQALATSAPRGNVDALLGAAGLADALDAVVCADDVRHGKPDPEIFLAAAARLGVAPSRAVVVEDARAGIEAARRGGMKVIGVLASFDHLGGDIDVTALDRLPDDAFDRLVPRL